MSLYNSTSFQIQWILNVEVSKLERGIILPRGYRFPVTQACDKCFSFTSIWYSYINFLRNWINTRDLKCFMRFGMNRCQQDYLGKTFNATKSWTTNHQVTTRGPSEMYSWMLIILGSLSLISLPLGHTQILTDWTYRSFLKQQYSFIQCKRNRTNHPII